MGNSFPLCDLRRSIVCLASSSGVHLGAPDGLATRAVELSRCQAKPDGAFLSPQSPSQRVEDHAGLCATRQGFATLPARKHRLLSWIIWQGLSVVCRRGFL